MFFYSYAFPEFASMKFAHTTTDVSGLANNLITSIGIGHELLR